MPVNRKKTKMMFLLVLLLSFLPDSIFPYEEYKQPMSDFPIKNLVLTKDYIFCASNGWRSNYYGLFIFDRLSQTWTNYSAANGFPAYKIVSVKKEGPDVDINFGGIVFRFNTDGSYSQIKSPGIGKAGKTFVFKKKHLSLKMIPVSDSWHVIKYQPFIIVNQGNKEKKYYASIKVRPSLKAGLEGSYSIYFLCPCIIKDDIYFVYLFDAQEMDYEILGFGTFNARTRKYSLYPANIFKKSLPTGFFIYKDSIIYTTAVSIEGDPKPGVGFVEFSTINRQYRIWKEVPLPGYPLAIISFDQDDRELWLGTDKGIFRVDKKNRKYIHYGIVSASAARDNVNVHGYFGHYSGTAYNNRYPVIYQLQKEEKVIPVTVIHNWCEIKSPCRNQGFVHHSDIKEINPKTNNITLRTDKEVYVKCGSEKEDNTLTIFGWYNPARGEFSGGSGSGRGENRWYQIDIPCAWVDRDLLVYSLGILKE